ncbi:MAG: hypothetical protein QGF94_04515, partial [Candidatus Thalassarchaeaceae archaeon]|nr:hypothetical protein [Candidatus Thalassarchaeaceae archaeon]
HCADLWPWAPDDTSPENVCGTRCNEQWGDRDGDGYGDNDSSDAWRRDAFPDDPTQHADTDSDGFGDNPIPAQNPDDCPVVWGNSTVDKNGCPDSDGDGHSNDYTYDTNTTTGLRENELGDALPDDPEQWRDRDGDGFGENTVGELWDRCPTQPGAEAGVLGPGCPLPAGDADADGVIDENDQCPDTPSGELPDIFGCSPSQRDTDLDSVSDAEDICPNTPTNETANSVGCSPSQTNQDSDGDGVNDIDLSGNQLDICPDTDPEDETVDENGCSDSQRDTDGDGVTDDIDECNFTTVGATVDMFGCIVVGADADDDGYEDAFDAFPSDPTQWEDTDGDGYGDNWADDSWNVSREGTVGQWVYLAQQPDACPHEFGTSWSANRALEGLYGCPDTDGDGVPDPSSNWTLEFGADHFPSNPTQYGDIDGDGFGDNPEGTNRDYCPNTSGIAGGDGGDGCPEGVDSDGDGLIDSADNCFQEDATGWDDDNDGCIDDNDDDNVKDDVDNCLNTPAEDWATVDSDPSSSTYGCSPSDQADSESSLMDGPLKYVLMVIGAIAGVALVLLVIGRFRNRGIDWDDDLLDDEYDDEDDWDPFSNTISMSKQAPTATSRGPPVRSTPPSRGPPGGAQSSPRGPPGGSQPASRGPPGRTSTPTSRPQGRPSGPGRISTPGPSPQSEQPVRRTRRTSSAPTSSDKPVRRTRRTSTPTVESESSAPVQRTRKTRKTAAPAKTTRRRKGAKSWDDLFAADEKEDFDAAVSSAKERLIVGDSEHSVLSRLQSEGWNVKQSKHILGHAKN